MVGEELGELTQLFPCLLILLSRLLFEQVALLWVSSNILAVLMAVQRLIDIFSKRLFELELRVEAPIVILRSQMLVKPLLLILHSILNPRRTIAILFPLILLQIVELFIEAMRTKLLILRSDPTRRSRRLLNTFIKGKTILACLRLSIKMQAHFIQMLRDFCWVMMELS